MSATARAVHAAIVAVGLLGISGTASTAVAQRLRHGTASAPQSQGVRPTQSRPRVAVAEETRPNVDQSPFATWSRDQDFSSRRRFSRQFAPAIVYYIPVPTGDAYASSRGGGGVYDTDGRPLYAAYEMQVARQLASQVSLADLSGSPYVVTEGGGMIVDFGDGHRRTVPPCAVLSATATPDGQPRTIFYQGPSDEIILRAGSTGRVRGTPDSSRKVCYAVDAYGRTELRY